MHADRAGGSMAEPAAVLCMQKKCTNMPMELEVTTICVIFEKSVYTDVA